MGCLNKRVEEEGIMVMCGEGAEEVDGVLIVELGCGEPDKAREAMCVTRGESRVARAEYVHCTEGGASNGPGGEARVEPGIGSDDWKTCGAIRD
jgi:hypothetical protein